MLSFIASSGWGPNSLVIKIAFLQGKNFDRIVFVTNAAEAGSKQVTLQKLNKCIYRLNNSLRVLYLTVSEELINLGTKVSKYSLISIWLVKIAIQVKKNKENSEKHANCRDFNEGKDH